jgi:hypothetical protein
MYWLANLELRTQILQHTILLLRMYLAPCWRNYHGEAHDHVVLFPFRIHLSTCSQMTSMVQPVWQANLWRRWDIWNTFTSISLVKSWHTSSWYLQDMTMYISSKVLLIIESSHCFRKGNRNSGRRLCIMVCPSSWEDYYMLIYTHCWELMISVGSHGSLSLPFVMKVMVCHFVSDSHEVMTALIVVLP